MASEGSHSIIERVIGAARLDVHIFEEVEADKSATRQAFLVVALVALANGIAFWGSAGVVGLVVGIVAFIAYNYFCRFFH